MSKCLLSIIISGLFIAGAASAQLIIDTRSDLDERYDYIIEQFEELEDAYPETTEVVELGFNDKEEMIYMLKVTDPEAEETSSQLVVGGHHGNEYGSVEVAFAFAKSVAENPLEGRTIYIVPVLNLTGYATSTRRENFVDPNRDYPGPCGSHDRSSSDPVEEDSEDAPFQLSSTTLLAEFLEEENISAALSLHTYSNVITYPWSVNYEQITNDHDTFVAMAELGAEKNGYRIGTAADLLYFVAGNFVDYAYWEHGIWALLFEIGDTHYPSRDTIAESIELNVPAMRDMLDVAPVERSESHAYELTCPKDEDILLNSILRGMYPDEHAH